MPFRLCFTIFTILYIKLISSSLLSISNKNKLSEGSKTTENSKEATKESISIELELEKHRMKLRHKKHLPKLKNMITENLIANTARYILDHGLERSIIENNNSRYKILSAKEASDNQDLNNAKIYEKDKKAYYGGTSLMDLNKDLNYITVSSNENKQKRFYGNLYEKDKSPYYGPPDEPTKIISNAPQDKFLTPIEIRDLSDNIDSEENRNRLEKEINDINTNKKEGVYQRDSNAYYDPTRKDKEIKKKQLKSALDQVRKDLNADQPEFTEENFRIRQKVQNYRNLNNEKDNELIGDNYWTDTKGYDKNTIYTAFDIGTEAKENKHKIIEAKAEGENSKAFYYPSKNKKYEADDISSENIAEKTSTRLDGKVEADAYINNSKKEKRKK